jgi:Family of unknown function (DUF6578)
MECCGNPFAVGSAVTWDLHAIDSGEREFLSDVFGAATAAGITDGYERHGGGDDEPVTTEVTGVVRSIRAVTWDIHPLAAAESPIADEQGLYAAPGSLAMETKTIASRGDTVDGRSCFGYLVELDAGSA